MHKKLEKKKKRYFLKSKKKIVNLDKFSDSLSLNELLSQLIVHHIGTN